MPLSGTWYNELNSVMELRLNQISNNGSVITGTYQSKVGDSGGIYSLYGASDEGTGDTTPNIGFSVSWVNPTYGNSNSVTSWSGQLQVIGGEEVITTFWLLTRETDPVNNWKSTIIGQDVFRRRPPTEAQVVARMSQGSLPHPA
jgi:hypothetical protein